jgi:hypothetical protein
VPISRSRHLSPALILFTSLFCFTSQVQAQQPDPLAKPATPTASKGAYQYGIEMLRFDAAWQLTKGRAHIAAVDGGMLEHPELQPGIDGNFRKHMSRYGPAPTVPPIYHAMLTIGVMAARGFNGVGISGGCAWCAVTLHETNGSGLGAVINEGIKSGAAVVNISLGNAVDKDREPETCPSTSIGAAECDALRRANERDVVVVSIAQNQSNAGAPPAANRLPWPANYPSVIAVGGVESDGSFWTHGYSGINSGSNWGPKMRLVAPAKDVLTLAKTNSYLYGDTTYPCGDRVDSLVSIAPTLPASYSGYGDCSGTSFSGPFVTALVGLMRSANPLLSVPEVQNILYDTATRPVPGPAGSGMTFYIPDAGAAVQRSLGVGATNRLTPMFSLYAPDALVHLFTSSPQTAITAIAGDYKLPAQTGAATYQSFGDRFPVYPTFTGKVCAANGSNCIQPEARALFSLFTTETSPNASRLAPLYRMSQVCSGTGAPPADGCKGVRTYAYATQRSEVAALEARGFAVDLVEGFVYASDQSQPAGTRKLCLAFDASRIDHILYASAECNQSQLVNSAGQTTDGNYQAVASLGFVPTAAAQTTKTVVEYYNGAAGPGWARTGDSFKAFAVEGAPAAANAVCRFYGSVSPGPNSHFYTASPVECEGVKQAQANTAAGQPKWNYEGIVFAAHLPVNGQCPADASVPVYRAYNNRAAQNDSNHRLTTRLAEYQATIAQGWVGEGVVMCAAP